MPTGASASVGQRVNHVSDPSLHRQLGLTDDEYAQIVVLMGREPNHFELAVFSLLWSEHCGYKHSRAVLRRFPTDGPAVLQGPGENAGVVDVGDGLGVAFKVESHNHPSAVEPFQGAATGVGGILRDVFAMGARPIAVLDSLRFGDPATERTRPGFERRPVEKLSTTVTWCPRSSSSSERWLPMKPAPPVISTRCGSASTEMSRFGSKSCMPADGAAGSCVHAPSAAVRRAGSLARVAGHRLVVLA